MRLWRRRRQAAPKCTWWETTVVDGQAWSVVCNRDAGDGELCGEHRAFLASASHDVNRP